MIVVVLLAQAASLGSGPQGIPGAWLNDGDYPAEAVRQKWSGPVELDLSINDRGRVTACKVGASSGHEVLDTASCKFLPARLRFKPARDESGRAIASGYFLRFIWTLPGQPPEPGQKRGPDMTLEVKQLPAGADVMELTVRMVQEADGTPVTCVVSEPSPSAALNQAACRLAAPLAKLDPVVDTHGVAVRNLRLRRLMFKQSK